MSPHLSTSQSLLPSLPCETHNNPASVQISHFISIVSRLTKTSPDSFPTLLSRYGPLERILVEYPHTLHYLPFKERALRWNRYLLDDILADGSQCRYQIHVTFNKPPNDLDTIIDFAIGVRSNQLFADGNHRTAVLSIFELLADQGKILKKADPFELYLILSHRKCPRQCCLTEDGCRQQVKISLRKYLLRRIRRTDVTEDSRRTSAESVKAIARWNTAMMESVDRIFREPKPDVVRGFKRKSPRRYRQMRKYII